MPKTTLRQKIFLILFGVLVTLLGLEIVLRSAGFIFLTLQERSNKISLIKSGAYTILCLGESTTALGGESAYPRQLEKILNSNQDKIQFTVINKGIPAITTSHIVLHLEKYLTQYRPQIVITMMGVNDVLESSKPFAASAYEPPWIKLLKEFRIYKLFHLMNLHLAAKHKEKQKRRLKRHLEKLEQGLAKKPNSAGFTQLAHLYRAASEPQKEFDFLRKALEIDPNNVEAQHALGFHYKRLGEYQEAVGIFENLLRQITPHSGKRVVIYSELGESYKLWGKYDQAERVFKESIHSFPQHAGAYGALGEMYRDQGRHPEAKILFEKQLEIDPQSIPIYGQLAYYYRREGRFGAAERLLKQGIQFNPSEAVLYSELGYWLLENKKYPEAEAILAKAMEFNSQNDAGIGKNLLAVYEAQGKTNEAQELRTAMLSQNEKFALQLRENYRKVKAGLSQKGIQMVAVQYPLRSLEELKRMLDSDPAVLFVDNQRIFQEAVLRDGYDEYFSDSFAGDFGHCTPQGNFILANNIAELILAQFSGKGK